MTAMLQIVMGGGPVEIFDIPMSKVSNNLHEFHASVINFKVWLYLTLTLLHF